MKKVLVISGSPRKSGNSDSLCDEFICGARESGNEVEKIFLAEKKVGFCHACYYCRDHGGECAIKRRYGRNFRENAELRRDRPCKSRVPTKSIRMIFGKLIAE